MAQSLSGRLLLERTCLQLPGAAAPAFSHIEPQRKCKQAKENFSTHVSILKLQIRLLHSIANGLFSDEYEYRMKNILCCHRFIVFFLDIYHIPCSHITLLCLLQGLSVLICMPPSTEVYEPRYNCPQPAHPHGLTV